jgi:hypothetical protein
VCPLSGSPSCASERPSVLSYVQFVAGGGGTSGWKGGACAWRKSEAPLCAARLPMCRLTRPHAAAGQQEEVDGREDRSDNVTGGGASVFGVEARECGPARIVVDAREREEGGRDEVEREQACQYDRG